MIFARPPRPRSRWHALYAASWILGVSMVSQAQPVSLGRHWFPDGGSIERIAPAIDALVATDARVEKIATGFHWSEGPVWSKADDALLFSDVPENRIYKWSPTEGLSVYLEPSGYTGSLHHFAEPGSNGLTFDSEGRLVICQHGNRQIARLRRHHGVHGKFEPIAGVYGGRRLNSPNDLCFSHTGNLYFTDPPYGLEGGNQSPLKETVNNGVYLRLPDGQLRLLISTMTFPNGIALSPDQTTLYVNQSDPENPVIRAFPVLRDGRVGEGRLFFDAKPLVAPGRVGLPDGMKVDAAGNVWCTGPGGVLVISSEGRHLGTILTGQPTGNCAWGDDGGTLYITANMNLLRVRTTTRGAGW